MNFLSRLECLMELARPYWRKIWTCDMLLQNLFPEFSPLNRRNGTCLWQQTCCRKQSQMKTLWGKSSRTTRRGPTSMTRRQTSVFAVEVCWFPETKESAPSAVKSQSHAQCFLWYVGHYSLWVRSTRPNCKPTALSTSFKRLRLAVSRKRPQKRAAWAWVLQNDNAPAQTAHSILVFLARHGIPIFQQPP